MNKSRFFSFIIMMFAAAIIVYVVVDNFTGEDQKEDDLGFLNSGEQEGSEENDSTVNVPFEPKDDVGLQRGMFAPDFTLPLWHTNEEVALSSFRGEIVVLNLWASWCPPCRKEMPDFIQLHNDYKDKGVHVLGVNLATLERNEEAAKEFMDEYEINFPTFVDQLTSNNRGVIQSLYQVQSIPHTYILDEEGRIFIAIRGAVNYEMLEREIQKLLN